MTDMEGNQLETLDSDECFRLLAAAQVGRLGVVADHYPLIIPVNFGLDRGTIVIRSSAGTKLAALEHANVTFEVDDIDSASRSGWSVLVRGQAEEVGVEHGQELLERTRATGTSPWAPGQREHWVRIIPHQITGRRIVLAPVPPSFGYM